VACQSYPDSLFACHERACAAWTDHYTFPAVKVLALDYGSARTGVAVSDPTGTVARPLEVVGSARSEAGLTRILELAREEGVERIVVGLPVTLRGERGAQAEETEHFLAQLRAATELPVESFDERFTTVLARGGEARAPEDAVAAAHLLTSYLQWKSDPPA
jgi:putative Holliday junction resolvase